MLQALLMILKIILWIILAILGLILLIVLLVLLAPIRYKVDAKYHKETGGAKVKARVSFLIAVVKVMFDQETKKLDYTISLAGIKLNLNKPKKPKKEKKNKKKDNETDLNENVIQDVDEISANNEMDSMSENIDTPTSKSLQESLDNDMSMENDELEDIDEFDLFDGNAVDDIPKEQRSILGRIKAFIQGIKTKIVKLRDKASDFSIDKVEAKVESKVNEIKRQYARIKKFWNLKCTVKTRKYLKKYLVGLIKHIGPRSIKGYVRYGFGDPAKTGQITGYLSLLPFVYNKHFSLEPDFYEKVIDTELVLKGRIHLGYIIRIVLNINIWRTILVARKVFRKKTTVNKEV
ncbi:MAG: DUF2953 domain-containing protein [Lachnospiraceae bacterium]|nr:DUF2953 domain-containing protein [Lachnospiraceae bacterium]